MKKILFIAVTLLVVLSIASCGSDVTEDTYNYVIDYEDATEFETALNNGEKVKDKVVQFQVKDYVPDSILGINCHAGEHLNFLFETEPFVDKGDTIVVRITEEPSKVFLIGSWKVPCEFLDITGVGELDTEKDDEIVSDNNSETTNANGGKEILENIVTMDADEFKRMNYKEAEEKLREMGFVKFEHKTVDTDNKSSEDTICYVEITEILFGDSDFVKGDKFDADSTVTLYSYKYKEPQKTSVSYSTNDYESAKKGNTGIFSYKRSMAYDVYWIVDFDAGCAYWFTEGNGEATYDKLKIVSGDLNDRITVTRNIDGEQTSWYLHFKYKNSPETLVVNDNVGVVTEFSATNLNNALDILNTKTLIEY